MARKKGSVQEVDYPTLTSVDYDEPLEVKVRRLLAAGKLTGSNSTILYPTSADPSVKRKGQEEITIGFIVGVPFWIRGPTVSTLNISYPEFKAEINRRPYRPAAPIEIADFIEDHPDVLEKMRRRWRKRTSWLTIAVPETVFKCDGYNYVIQIKSSDENNYKLSSRWVGGGWDGGPGQYVAVVLKRRK